MELIAGLNGSHPFPRPPIEAELLNLTCTFVHQLATLEEQCAYVLNNGSCEYDGIFYSYTTLTYCQLGSVKPLALTLLLAILFMLFVAMGSVADDFLCPSLLTISDTFRLPDHIAGVTFLALGNGAPDIFSSISGISQAKPHLVFSALYGAGIFTTTVVTGAVLFSGDFSVMKRPLVRDLTFYIGAAIIVWAFIYTGTLQIGHSLSLVGYYLVYIIVLVVSRFIYVHYNCTKGSEEDTEEEEEGTTGSSGKLADIEADARSLKSVRSGSHPHEHAHHCELDGHGVVSLSRKNSSTSHASATSTASRKRGFSYEDGIVLTRFFRKGSLRSSRRRTHSALRHHHLVHHHFEHTLNHLTKAYEVDRKLGVVEDVRYKETIAMEQAKVAAVKKAGYHNEITFTNNFGKPKLLPQMSTASIWSARSWENALSESKDFFIHICPIDVIEWKEYAWYRKALEIVKALPYFIMTTCIPVVDIESPRENWCRLLTCLNIVAAPQMVLLLYNRSVFPLWALILLLSLAVSIAVFFTSTKERQPVYHRVFGFLGFIMSVAFINIIASEVVCVLETFGVVFNLSDAILGMTVLAWGNSLGDLISNNSLARHGYPGIAIAACFGGPMLNLLMGVGLPYTILFVGEETSSIGVEYSTMTTLLFVTIMLSLTCTFTFFIVNHFKSSKIHGSILFSIYILYIVTALVLEFFLN